MKELRFIVNPFCNENCLFCHREGYPILTEPLLVPKDYGFLFEVCKEKYGFDTCTITGGEPLLRSDIEDIVRTLYSKGAKITLVTNGTLLERRRDVLRYISELHISLHTLNKEDYTKITRSKEEQFDEVLKGIKIAKKYPVEIKINYCFLKNVNDKFQDFLKLYEFCKLNNITLRVIELLKPYDRGYFTPVTEIKSWIEYLGIKKIYKDARRESREINYELENGAKISIITYLCNYRSFYNKKTLEIKCKNFMDFFVTHDGKIKYCFLTDKGISILREIKSKNKDKIIKKLEHAFNRIGKECLQPFINAKEFKRYHNFFLNKKTFQITSVYSAIFRGDSILLLERRKPHVLEFPGGNIEFNETPQEAIKREIREETGIEVSKIQLFDVSSVTFPNNFVQQVLLLFVTKLDKNVKIIISPEHENYKWVRVDKLGQINNLALSIKPFVPKLMNYGRRF
jgi:mutator protein MutT